MDDPCFVSPLDGVTALCPSDPTGGDAVELTITTDTAEDPEIAPNEGDPWFMVLEDGQSCSMLGGATTTLAGMRMNYACDGGYGFGDVERSGPVWTVRFQRDGSAVLVVAAVRTAWF